LKTLNDLIYFNKALYAFFTNNQLSIYSLHSENGTLSQKYSFTIDHPTMIDDGHFVEVQGHLLIVSSKLAVRVLEEGSYDRVSTYNGTVNDISDFKVINSTVYLGLSSKGIEVYNYIASNNSLVFTKKATFGFKSRFEEASFSVDELDIDASTRSLYILDYIEGLLEVPLAHLT
jgi:N-acetylneuraminic acid mutarotase